MEYISELLWLSLWPTVIYISYKLAVRNVLKFEKKNQ